MSLLNTFLEHLMYSEEELHSKEIELRNKTTFQSSDLLKHCQTQEEAVDKLNAMLEVIEAIKKLEHKHKVLIGFGDDIMYVEYNDSLKRISVSRK